MGPLLFNIFINEVFYFIEHGTLYNYADDNTLSYADEDYNTLIELISNLQGISVVCSDIHGPFWKHTKNHEKYY
jgi:hypothetical protein